MGAPQLPPQLLAAGLKALPKERMCQRATFLTAVAIQQSSGELRHHTDAMCVIMPNICFSHICFLKQTLQEEREWQVCGQRTSQKCAPCRRPSVSLLHPKTLLAEPREAILRKRRHLSTGTVLLIFRHV